MYWLPKKLFAISKMQRFRLKLLLALQFPEIMVFPFSLSCCRRRRRRRRSRRRPLPLPPPPPPPPPFLLLLFILLLLLLLLLFLLLLPFYRTSFKSSVFGGRYLRISVSTKNSDNFETRSNGTEILEKSRSCWISERRTIHLNCIQMEQKLVLG